MVLAGKGYRPHQGFDHDQEEAATDKKMDDYFFESKEHVSSATPFADAEKAAAAARDAAAGLKIELNEVRAARDAFAAEAREALAQREAAERRSIDAFAARKEVDAMAAEAEEALRRARQAERDAAVEVASLREESEALARRIEHQRLDEDAAKRKREVETVVERLGLADREVLQHTSRNASTMRGLEQALAELARRVREGDAANSKSGPSPTKSGLLASGESPASGDENAGPTSDAPPTRADPADGAGDDVFFVLSQSTAQRRAPWFPEVNALATPTPRRDTATVAPPALGSSRDAAAVSNAPGASGAPRQRSIVADAALEADAAAAAARSIRASRGKTADAGAARSGRVREGESDCRDAAESAASAALVELDESAPSLARASRADRGSARASLEKLRASQSGDRPDWEVRLELIEAENERTRLRLERARLGRGADDAAPLEAPKPREASPPQPWR